MTNLKKEWLLLALSGVFGGISYSLFHESEKLGDQRRKEQRIWADAVRNPVNLTDNVRD